MIVVDSSAIIAILLREADRDTYARAIVAADRNVMSTFTYFEATVALCARKGDPVAAIAIDRFLTSQAFELAPYDRDQAELSRTAYQRFGKGFHPAALNLGDCVSYALAKSLDAPLLFKGDDFAKTDVRRAVD